MTKLEEAYTEHLIVHGVGMKMQDLPMWRTSFMAGAAAMAELFATGHGLNVKHETATAKRCQWLRRHDARQCTKDEGHGGEHVYEFFGPA